MAKLAGVKNTVASAATGAGSYYLYGFLVKMMPTVFSNKFAGPAAMAVLGHVLSRRQRFQSAGLGMVGAAGYALAYNMALAASAETRGLEAGPGRNHQLEVGETIDDDMNFEPARVAVAAE